MTVKSLYARTTGDKATHQRTIDAGLRRLTPHQQARIKLRATGKSYQQIATAEGEVSPASVRDSILRGIETIRKGIAEEPRYNHGGRASRRKRNG
jgi:DNA-directed RNA polymerase specialized sigma24 family protein